MSGSKGSETGTTTDALDEAAKQIDIVNREKAQRHRQSLNGKSENGMDHKDSPARHPPSRDGKTEPVTRKDES